ncbi:glycerol-3-phosphate acyltransferase 2, mitochondrial-like [Rhinophrynus dorsalis]
MGSEPQKVQSPTKAKTGTRIWTLGLGQKIETICLFQGKYRPFVGQACQACTPKSMESFFYKRYAHMGFRNVLHITEEDSRIRGWLVRRLCCVIYICERPPDRDVSSEFPMKIFRHPRVTRWLLVKMLSLLFLNVQLHCGQLAALGEACAVCSGIPVVFLSTHPSWLDSLLIPFLLFSQELVVPRVAWARTGCIPFLRTVLQRLGVLFLPTDEGSGTVSAAVLSVYTETFLSEGHSLLIFLESPPTSCSHPLSPSGRKWVQQIIGTLQSGAVADALIVPVGISYDSRLDCGYGGREVAPPSSACSWKSFLSALCPWSNKLGCVRVDFAQPFSLQAAGHIGCDQLIWSISRLLVVAETTRHLPVGLLQPAPNGDRLWSHVSIDFMVELPVSKGNTIILMIVDKFSKMAHFVPLKGLPSSKELAEIFSRKNSPFLINYGFQSALLPDSLEAQEIPALNEHLGQLCSTWVQVQRATQLYKRHADRRRGATPVFQVGDRLWLFSRNLSLQVPCKKLAPWFVGPYQVLRRNNPVSYTLELPAGMSSYNVFHVSLLKPLVCNCYTLVPVLPGPFQINGQEEYEYLIVVLKKADGRLPILYLKHFNLYVETARFKMESLRSVIATMCLGEYLASIDLQDTYLHIPIHQDSQCSLLFAFDSEYISSYKRMHLTSARPLQETLLPCILGFRNRMQDEAELEAEPGAGADQEQALVDAFILHSLQAAVSCSAIMSSHIMAALLLYKYRAGVSLSRLLCDFPVLIEEILLHRFDVGFSGQRWDLVLHSLQILRRSVTLYSAPPIDIYVFCKESQAAVRELAYHSAALLPVFLYEALGACAVLALLSEVSCLGVVESLFAQDELIGKLMCLCSLLPRTLLLLPPCQSLYKVCQDVLDRLIQCGLIAMYEDPSAPPPCDTGRRRFVDKLMWRAMDEMTDSDSDHMEEEVKRYYKLGHSERHADSFIFLCRLLSPVLKTYERAALFLQENEEFVQDTEPAYVNMLHQYLLQKAKEDGSFECAEHSLAVCAVRTFVDLGVFKCHGSMLCLSETFLLQENCRRLIRFIQQFVYNG